MSKLLNATLCLATVACLTANAQNVKTRHYQPEKNSSFLVGDTRVRQIKPLDPIPFAGEQPFAFAMMPQVETPDRTWDSVFFRFNLFVGAHRSVYWLDLGVLGNITDYEMSGLGIACLFNNTGMAPAAFHIAGAVNHCSWNFSGLQLSAGFNWTEGALSGLQLSCVNSAGRLNGMQVGLVNVAEQGAGAHIGVINVADRLEGLQIGLLNINRDSVISVSPFLNFAF
jgi:hypothetical protein